jgi:hypothetical protein
MHKINYATFFAFYTEKYARQSKTYVHKKQKKLAHLKTSLPTQLIQEIISHNSSRNPMDWIIWTG